MNEQEWSETICRLYLLEVHSFQDDCLLASAEAS